MYLISETGTGDTHHTSIILLIDKIGISPINLSNSEKNRLEKEGEWIMFCQSLSNLLSIGVTYTLEKNQTKN